MTWLVIARQQGRYLPTCRIYLYIVRQLIRLMEVSNCQKQSVSDAFQNVVLPPTAAPTSS